MQVLKSLIIHEQINLILFLFSFFFLFHLIFLMFGMKCLCSLIMVKSGGCRRADFGMVLSPPQVEPWRVKQGAEAVDS